MEEFITAGWRHHGTRVIGFGFVLGLIAALLPVAGAVAATDRPTVDVATSSAAENVERSRADSGEPSGEPSIARTDSEDSDDDDSDDDRASRDESRGDEANGPATAEPSDDAARASHAGGSRPSRARLARDRGIERASESRTIDAGGKSSPGNVSGESSGDPVPGASSIAPAERERSGDRGGKKDDHEHGGGRKDDREHRDLGDSGERSGDEPDGPAAAAGRAPKAGSEFSTRAVADDGAAQESAYAESRRVAVSEGDSDWSESASGEEGGVDASSSEADGDASGAVTPEDRASGDPSISAQLEPSAPAPSAESLPSTVRPNAPGADHQLAPSDIEAAQRARPRATSSAAAIGLPFDRKGTSVGSGPLMAPQEASTTPLVAAARAAIGVAAAGAHDRAASGRRSPARHSAHDRAGSGRRSPARPWASPQSGQATAGAASAKDAAPNGAVLAYSMLAVVGVLFVVRRRMRVPHSILQASRIERPG